MGGSREVSLEVVDLTPPEGCSVILGQTHFIKSVEDIYEALADSAPEIRFGIAFCESSGDRLIRHSGNDEDMEEAAVEMAKRLGAGHSFVAVFRGAWPVNVLPRLRGVPEIVTLFAATSNPLRVVVAHAGDQRGVVAVLDGFAPLGVEGDEGRAWRRDVVRKFGYKEPG